jgi:hypothetical protein
MMKGACGAGSGRAVAAPCDVEIDRCSQATAYFCLQIHWHGLRVRDGRPLDWRPRYAAVCALGAECAQHCRSAKPTPSVPSL